MFVLLFITVVGHSKQEFSTADRVSYKSCLSCPEFGPDFFAPRRKITFVAVFGTFVVGFGIISISWLKVILGAGFTLLTPCRV